MNARTLLAFASMLAAPAVASAQQRPPVTAPRAPTAFGVAGTLRTAPQPSNAADTEPLAQPDPRTIRSPWSIAVDTHITWPLDPRATTFQREPGAMAGPGFSFARDVVPFGRNGALQVGVVFAYASSDGLVAQTINTHLVTIQFGADATLRVPWLTWLTPHVRLGASALVLDTRVSGAMGNALAGGAWSALGTLGAGFTFHTPAGVLSANSPRALLGLRVEGGYQLGTPASLDVSPPAPSDATTAADRVPVQSTHIGTLLPHGPYLRISFVIRF